MPRRIGGGVAVLLVLALASVAALVSPDSALAQTTTPYESLRSGSSTYLDDFYTKILHDSERAQSWNSSVSTSSNASKNVIYRQVTKARIGARLLPNLATFAARASLVGSAGYVGWLIYQNYSGGSKEHDMWLDSASLGANALFNPCVAPPGLNCPGPMGWDATDYGPNGNETSGTGLSFLSSYQREIGAAWVLVNSVSNNNGGCSTALTGVSPPCFELHLNPYGYRALGESRDGSWHGNQCAHLDYQFDEFSSCWVRWSDADALGLVSTYWQNDSQAQYSASWPGQLAFAVEQTFDAIVANTPGAIVATVGTYMHGATPVHRVKAVISDEDLQSGAIFTDDQGTPSQTYNYTLPSPYYADPGAVGTETDTDTALNEFDSPCGQAFLNWVLEPGTYSFDPEACGGWSSVPTFPLVQPLVNEPYADYLQRLRDLGWLGSATSSVAAEGEELVQMGPEGVTRIRIGQNVYRPTSWPSSAPRWNVNVNIVVTYNPAEIPEAPGGGEPLPPGTGGGTGVPVPPTGPLGSWCEACPPVDFSPLTSADFGGTFPFGVVPWSGDFLGSMTTAADAPVFDFDFDWLGIDPNYVVDLEVLDVYMATIRTILSFVVWIGGLWWFGSRLLGFRETGDPGAAVDDAW